jgi:hypothetical protein
MYVRDIYFDFTRCTALLAVSLHVYEKLLDFSFTYIEDSTRVEGFGAVYN